MRLTSLQPQWVNYESASYVDRFTDLHTHVEYDQEEVAEGYHDQLEEFAKADGVMFLCPVCFVKNGGPVGTESVLCWFANKPYIPASAIPGPGRWTASGSSFDDLSLSPSVNVSNGHWHGF